MDDSTLISNLPDKTSNSSAQDIFRNGNSETKENIYVPMNVHSSPYGFKNDIDSQETTQHRLPSRDIPNNQTNYTQDEVIKPNYIEKPKDMKDYIKDYKKEESQRIREHNRKKNETSLIDKTIFKIQEVLLIAILYFISNMEIVNISIKRYLSILRLFENDGNLNMYGNIFKCISFAFVYHISFQLINSSFPTF